MALGTRLATVKKANANETVEHDAIAKPNHSMISPRKLPQDTNLKRPPEKETIYIIHYEHIFNANLTSIR